MCNAYTVRPKIGSLAFETAVSKEIDQLRSPLVRRSDPGVVVRLAGESLIPETMRWGFARPFGNAINNTRSDHLDSPTWADALREHRCLVPMSTFYEWQHLNGKAKQAHEFRRPDGGWLWVAAIYERTDALGACYSTLTTEPAPVVSPIHDRMLAVLEFSEGLAFLRGELSDFSPYDGHLLAIPCESPLKKKPPPEEDLQGQLF